MPKDRLLIAFAAAAILAGCADQPPADDPNVVTLPGSGLRFAVKDANDRHLTVENGKECEQRAGALTSGMHPGRDAAKSTAEGALEGLWAWQNTPGAVLGAIGGALSGNAVGVMNGSADVYTRMVRGCMEGMGHKPVD